MMSIFISNNKIYYSFIFIICIIIHMNFKNEIFEVMF